MDLGPQGETIKSLSENQTNIDKNLLNRQASPTRGIETATFALG
jgi:hypothetical protein